MELIKHLLGMIRADDVSGLLPAIDRAVTSVAPLLKQARGYPDRYRKPVATALEYAHSLASSIPGPIAVDSKTYASDAFVHAIFPSADFISDAFRSSRALLEYCQKFPGSNEIYALMGMRRMEKSMMGMELAGQVIQRDVPQNVVYFTCHTIEDPASSEQQAREQVAWDFFDKLVYKVAKRVEARKLEKQELLREKDILAARLHVAAPEARPALETKLYRILDSVQAISSSLDLNNYVEDFESVLLHPEQHLQLKQSTISLDSMGVRKSGEGAAQAEPVVFNDLIGFDYRNWTVTMIHCRDVPHETFAARLEAAQRRLSIFTETGKHAGIA
ncbi:MAG: hypothetical protein OEV35_03330 [Gallionellaceae bacterium]|nr:hypothetical protein [Gallionellaceae bacterium]